MKITGLPAFQRFALKKHLSKVTVNDDAEIRFSESISLRRLHSLWHGGHMVDVIYKGHTFHIEARGDIRCNLNLVNNDDTVCYVKDKNNNCNFGSEMLSYFRSDKVLYKVLTHEHRTYYLATHDTNWWECFVTDDKGVFHDISWVLNDDDLFSGISEVLSGMDEVISNLKEAA